MSTQRKCITCGKELHACMGFVIIGDLMHNGVFLNQPSKLPREICGVCDMRTWLDPEFRDNLHALIQSG